MSQLNDRGEPPATKRRSKARQCANNLRTRWHIVISRRDIWNSDHVGPIGFCGQLGVIVVIGIQVRKIGALPLNGPYIDTS